MGKLPFYWGKGPDGNLAVSDSRDIIKAACGKSFAPFPNGEEHLLNY